MTRGAGEKIVAGPPPPKLKTAKWRAVPAACGEGRNGSKLISILASIALADSDSDSGRRRSSAGKFSPKLKVSPGTRLSPAFRQAGESHRVAWAFVFSVLNTLGLIFISTEPGEWVAKLVAAVLWVGVGRP